MNWGGFAAGLSAGIGTGIKLGNTLEEGNKKRALDDILKQSRAEATQTRSAAVNGLINDTGASSDKGSNSVATTQPVTEAKVEQKPLSDITPTATAPTTPASTGETATPAAEKPTAVSPQAPAQVAASGIQPAQDGRFVVGNKRFATREEAQAEADKRVAPIDNFVTDNILKKQQQFYIGQGEVEKADQLGKYMESQRGQRAVKTYGKAMTALMSGDIDNGVKHLGEYYNQNVDDGVDFTGHSITPDGNIAITLRKKDGGGESQMVMSKRDLLMLGFAHDPVKLQAQLLDAQTAKDKSANEMAKEDRAAKREDYRDKRNFEQQKEIKSLDQNNAIEKMTIEKQMDAANASAKVKREVGAKVEALRSAGYSDDFINGVLPGIIGVGEYKKATSPEEARRLAFGDRMKADVTFGNKPAAEQQKIIDQDMKLIYGGVKPSATPSSASPASPVSGGLPQPQAAKQKGIPVYDATTGKIIYR